MKIVDYKTRYQQLNTAQKQAVDTIDGPVMVIAGPGTGKTELLSMRTATILKQTDTLPQNILCLTFTESGATAMRERLAQIIGRDAYRVAIHTFHSFGSDVIAMNREYFYHGAEFRAADELTQLEMLTTIFRELDHTNILASKMNDEYTYLRDALRTISDLKRSGLTSDELLKILDASDTVLDYIEADIASLFAARISKKVIEAIPAVASKLAKLAPEPLPLGLTPLSEVMAHSLARAYDEASEAGSTKPITAWKAVWCEKDSKNNLVLKDRKRHEKLRAMSFIYYRYLQAMQTAALYDFDDMILEVIHAVETQHDLKLNLQEAYQYVMVDEFQDTNLAQLRLLLNLVDNPVHEGEPNLLLVGDDDQAIYSFQGADVNNIMQIRRHFQTIKQIVLTDNYRSAPAVLSTARSVITQSNDRLEAFDASLNKSLTPHVPVEGSSVELSEYQTTGEERAGIAVAIQKSVASGQSPSSIVVLARKHAELEALLPYFAAQGVRVNYERRDNVLELDIIKQLELLSSVVIYILRSQIDKVEALLPELLSHPAWEIPPEIIWQLSLSAYRERRPWCDYMTTIPELAPLHNWLVEMSQLAANEPLERMIDQLIGVPADQSTDDNELFSSPLFMYYFNDKNRQDDPEIYLIFLDALREIRARLRDYTVADQLKLEDLLEYINLHRAFDRPITIARPSSKMVDDAINLMTTHKAKGLEFDNVYIIGLSDQTWGSRVRMRSPNISYPENLLLAPSIGSLDEQLRLLYVGLTRAKRNLHLSYSRLDSKSHEHLVSEFLLNNDLPVNTIQSKNELTDIIERAEFDWRSSVLSLAPQTMQELLSSQLERYKLSATHINNFIDVTSGGPHYFLLQNLLHFPSALNPAASFGTAIHATLQAAQSHLLATGEYKPLEDSLHDFETTLSHGPLDEKEREFYTQRGYDALRSFLGSTYTGFSSRSKAEVDFSREAVHFGDAHLTGKLDLVTIDRDEKTIAVVDYKTGKPSSNWQGKAIYDKIKLHKYKQQLMFYKLLAEQSRSFHGFHYASGALQFVEPDRSGDILPPLEADFSDEEYASFQKLVSAVWHCITTLELPDTSQYSDDIKGILAFEQFLIDKYS